MVTHALFSMTAEAPEKENKDRCAHLRILRQANGGCVFAEIALGYRSDGLLGAGDAGSCYFCKNLVSTG